jgi:hypothetical protein
MRRSRCFRLEVDPARRAFHDSAVRESPEAFA